MLGALALSGPALIVVVCAIAKGRERELFAVLFVVVLVLCLKSALS